MTLQGTEREQNPKISPLGGRERSGACTQSTGISGHSPREKPWVALSI